jgi:hypothetical protein
MPTGVSQNVRMCCITIALCAVMDGHIAIPSLGAKWTHALLLFVLQLHAWMRLFKLDVMCHALTPSLYNTRLFARASSVDHSHACLSDLHTNRRGIARLIVNEPTGKRVTTKLSARR